MGRPTKSDTRMQPKNFEETTYKWDASNMGTRMNATIGQWDLQEEKRKVEHFGSD